MSDEGLTDLRRFAASMEATQAELEAGGFHEHLHGEDLLGTVLRTHMWVERELTAIIEALLRHPERLKRRWSFAHRLELVAANDILDPADLPAYEELDRLRNRLAHRLEDEVSPDDEERLVRALRPELRNAVQANSRDEPFPHHLRRALHLMVFMLKLRRQGFEPKPLTPTPPEDAS